MPTRKVRKKVVPVGTPPKKLVWVSAAQVETKDAAAALDEIRRVRFPAPSGKVGRPKARPNILGII